MPTLLEIKKILSQVAEPNTGKDLLSLNMVKDVTVENGCVSVSVEVKPSQVSKEEEIRRSADKAIRQLSGVREVSIQFLSGIATAPKPSSKKPLLQEVDKVIAVYACKGGVGKTTISINLAASLALDGAKVGLLDADIYGPNVPMMMGLSGYPDVDAENHKIFPMKAHGVKVMSMGVLTREETPMMWRGPMVHGAVRQLIADTEWGDLDYLIVDLPPGTGDAQLTLIQTVPLSGVVIVTTPQAVSLLDGAKGIEMFRKLNVPVLGIVENMSGFVCAHCGQETPIFSKGGGRVQAEKYAVPFLGEIPLDPGLVIAGDEGKPLVVNQPKSQAALSMRELTRQMVQQVLSGGSQKEDLKIEQE